MPPQPLAMRICIIAALDENNAIGYQQHLPWRLPADLRHFKALTLGFPLIIGRRTFESIGRPLPGRANLIVTRQAGYQAPGCHIAHSLPQALEWARQQGAPKCFIGGGRELYREGLGVAHQLYITRIHHRFRADVSFPEFDLAQWVAQSIEAHPPDAENPYPFTFFVYERRK